LLFKAENVPTVDKNTYHVTVSNVVYRCNIECWFKNLRQKKKEMWIDVDESETDRERVGNQRRKEGEDGKERELERSRTHMQFVNVKVEVLTAMLMKFPTFGNMTL
jgi:hypothetical protein